MRRAFVMVLRKERRKGKGRKAESLGSRGGRSGVSLGSTGPAQLPDSRPASHSEPGFPRRLLAREPSRGTPPAPAYKVGESRKTRFPAPRGARTRTAAHPHPSGALEWHTDPGRRLSEPAWGPGDISYARANTHTHTHTALAARSVLPSNRPATPLFSPACWELGNPAGLSSCSGGLRPLVELCVEPAAPPEDTPEEPAPSIPGKRDG